MGKEEPDEKWKAIQGTEARSGGSPSQKTSTGAKTHAPAQVAVSTRLASPWNGRPLCSWMPRCHGGLLDARRCSSRSSSSSIQDGAGDSMYSSSGSVSECVWRSGQQGNKAPLSSMCAPAVTDPGLEPSRTAQAGQPKPDRCPGFHPNGLSRKRRGGAVRDVSTRAI